MVEANPYPVTTRRRWWSRSSARRSSRVSLGLGDLGALAPDELTLVGRESYVSVPERPGALQADGGADEAPSADHRHRAQLADGDGACRAVPRERMSD